MSTFDSHPHNHLSPFHNPNLASASVSGSVSRLSRDNLLHAGKRTSHLRRGPKGTSVSRRFFTYWFTTQFRKLGAKEIRGGQGKRRKRHGEEVLWKSCAGKRRGKERGRGRRFGRPCSGDGRRSRERGIGLKGCNGKDSPRFFTSYYSTKDQWSLGGQASNRRGGWRLGIIMKHKMNREWGSKRQPDQPPPYPKVL